MGNYKRRHKKHTTAALDILERDMAANFRAFMEKHNAEAQNRQAEEIAPDMDFAERHLAKMMRELGVRG